jgi:hypothetical protein
VKEEALTHWELLRQKEWCDLDSSGSENGLDGRFFEYPNESYISKNSRRVL